MAIVNHFFLQFLGPQQSNKSLNTINFPLTVHSDIHYLTIL